MNQPPIVKAQPHWITAKYKGRCASCRAPINPGDRAWFWPASRELYCVAFKCGTGAALDFQSAVQDEEQMNSQFARPF